MEVLRIVIAGAPVFDPRTLVALEECCKELAPDVLWRRERMALEYAKIAHGRWPAEIVGDPPLDGPTTTQRLWLDDWDMRRVPFDSGTRMRDAMQVLALLKHVRDPCPKRAREREAAACRTSSHACDDAWEAATKDYIERGYGSMALALEAYKLWEPYYRMDDESRSIIGRRHSWRDSFVPPDSETMRRRLAEYRDRKAFIASLGPSKYAAEPASELDKIVIAARVERERVLMEAMKSRNLEMRRDSVIARLHIMTGDRTVQEVCDIAEEMDWMYDNGYDKQLQMLYRDPKEYRKVVNRLDAETPDQVKISNAAKDAVVRSELYRTDGAVPTERLPARVAARFDRLSQEPTFESRSPWD